MTLATGKGNSLVLNDTDSEVVLTHADSGNSIRISADGIELTAAQGDISLSSRPARSSSTSIKLEGKASGTVEAGELGHLRHQGIRAAGPQGCPGQHQLGGGAMPGAARVGDTTVHGGTVVGPGVATVLIAGHAGRRRR